KKKTLLGSMVSANDNQEEPDRNNSILIDIISVKPITLSNNYEKSIPIDTKNSAHKKCLIKHDKTNTSTNNEPETSQTGKEKRNTSIYSKKSKTNCKRPKENANQPYGMAISQSSLG
ncbi:7359_t:CDS:2, partial [Dentiscutata heterogama]